MASSAADAEILIIEHLYAVVQDDSRIYSAWKSLVARHSVAGKQIHDARIVAAMLIHNVTQVLTFNSDDFKRYGSVTAVNPCDLV